MAKYGKNGGDFLHYLKNKKAVINGDSGLKKWKQSLRQLDTVIDLNIIGDSIVAGSGAGTTYADVWNLSFTGKLRTHFKNKYGDVGEGLKGHAWWYQPDHMIMTYGGTWNTHTMGDNGFGTNSQSTSNGATISIPFTGTGIKIFYYQGSSSFYGDFTTKIDEEEPVARTSSGAVVKYQSLNITGLEDGEHTLLITKTDTKRLFFFGAMELNNATKGVRVNNMGTVGIGAYQNWPLASSNVSLACAYAQPSKLSILCIGVNDKLTNVTPTNFKSAVTDMITSLKTAGSDVLLIVEGVNSTSGTYPWSQYVNALYDLAYLNNCALIDFSTIWGGYKGSIGGKISSKTTDGIHPNYIGHDEMANVLIKILD